MNSTWHYDRKSDNNSNKNQISMRDGHLAKKNEGEGESKHFNQIQYTSLLIYFCQTYLVEYLKCF